MSDADVRDRKLELKDIEEPGLGVWGLGIRVYGLGLGFGIRDKGSGVRD